MKKPRRLLAPLFVAASVGLFASPPVEHLVFPNGMLLSPPQPVSIIAFGDMMLDRSVREYINVYGPEYPFLLMEPLIKGHDIVVANAEGSFSSNASVSVRDHSILRFTFATSSLPTITKVGFSVLSQANNHGLDFGWSALEESKEAMAAVGIASFGDPQNVEPGPLYKEVRGELIAFVGYNQFSSSGGDSKTTLAAIAEAHERGAFTIVYPHWGEEYNDGTTDLQKLLGHKFVDEGADLVLGSHPHVVEPYEIYKGKAIFYSLGNFIFDQSWNAAVAHGRAVEVWLRPQSVSYTLWPFEIKERRATPRAVPEESFVLER